MNKCIKVVLNKCLNRDMKEVKNIIRDMSYLSCKASNKAIAMWKDHTIEMMEMKNKDKNFNQQQYEKDTYGKTYRNVIEGNIKDIMNICSTSNVGTMHQQLVQNDWKRLKNDVLNYRANLPTYKLDTPVYIRNNNYVLTNHNGYYVDIALYNKNGLESIGEKVGYKIEFQIDKLDDSKKATLNKIINGEYKQGSSQLKISKKGKIELTISFAFEPQIKELDRNRRLGIDLGIVNVAAMSIWDNNKVNKNGTKGDWEYVNYKHNILDGKELIRFKQKLYNMGKSKKEIEKAIERYNEHLHQVQLDKYEIGSINGILLNKYRNTTDKLRKELNIASKWRGEGSGGHGRKTRCDVLEKQRTKCANFADTFNHKYSKYIVDFAIKNNCGVIQMEDLSKITEDVHEKFLKEWSYYNLQEKIKDKADEIGIKVIKVDPKYTSKRCSNCGCIHEDNRNCKENQGKFECVVCNHNENADINASKNISIPNIDVIIENTEVLKTS